MAPFKEKGRPGEGGPIPKCVLGRNEAESIETARMLQVSRLSRRFALSLPAALVLAGLAYDGGVGR